MGTKLTKLLTNLFSTFQPDIPNTEDEGQFERCCLLSFVCGHQLTRFEIALRILAGLVFVIIIISLFKNAW